MCVLLGGGGEGQEALPHFEKTCDRRYVEQTCEPRSIQVPMGTHLLLCTGRSPAKRRCCSCVPRCDDCIALDAARPACRSAADMAPHTPQPVSICESFARAAFPAPCLPFTQPPVRCDFSARNRTQCFPVSIEQKYLMCVQVCRSSEATDSSCYFLGPKALKSTHRPFATDESAPAPL